MYSLLLPEVIRDLELVRHGYRVQSFDPQYFVSFPDGRHLVSFLESRRTPGRGRRAPPTSSSTIS